MPHKEKAAWLALAAMLAAYVPFFAIAAVSPPAPPPNLRLIGLFAAVSVLRVVILGLGSLWFRLSSPDDARAPADERDRAVSRRATSIAYFVLMAGALATGCILPFYTGGWDIVGATILVVVLAEIARCSLVVVGYRRGWHG
jgi:hypothetical protein